MYSNFYQFIVFDYFHIHGFFVTELGFMECE
jgi:hypothetical protein